jgi:acyl-CoA thioester hydrolase
LNLETFAADRGLLIGRPRVLRAWTDHNGHMNLAAYLIAFDRCFARFCNGIGIGPEQKEATGKTIFVAETHLVYRRELLFNERVEVGLRILELSPKRMRSYLTMLHGDGAELVCVNEQLDTCVDLATRRSGEFPPDVYERLRQLHDRESTLPPAVYAGRGIALPASHKQSI